MIDNLSSGLKNFFFANSSINNNETRKLKQNIVEKMSSKICKRWGWSRKEKQIRKNICFIFKFYVFYYKWI